jgi:hypothetical protein
MLVACLKHKYHFAHNINAEVSCHTHDVNILIFLFTKGEIIAPFQYPAFEEAIQSVLFSGPEYIPNLPE